MLTKQDYEAQRKTTLTTFNRLARGTRAKCAFDLRLHPSRVSGILNGRTVHQELLNRVTRWVQLVLLEK